MEAGLESLRAGNSPPDLWLFHGDVIAETLCEHLFQRYSGSSECVSEKVGPEKEASVYEDEN
jgi:hypothetical protein